MRVGIPCSQLQEYVSDLPCTSEAEAMALAAGVILAGGTVDVFMQNSGLGHIVDIVTSLYHPYQIQLPHLILSMRSSPAHHISMYSITRPLLELVGCTDYETIGSD